MEIALFKGVKYGVEIISKRFLEDDSEYVRLTEYVDVEFTPLDHHDVTAKEIEIIRQEKKNIQAETELKLNAMDARIGELLALPPG